MPLCFNLIACSSGDNNAISVDVNCVTGSILGKAAAAATGSGCFGQGGVLISDTCVAGAKV